MQHDCDMDGLETGMDCGWLTAIALTSEFR
jgi:hypothetical protein